VAAVAGHGREHTRHRGTVAAAGASGVPITPALRVMQYWNHLEGFFGAGQRAVDVTGVRLDDYAAGRLAEGAARQTVNNELSALRRAFRLAIDKGVLATAPVFKLPCPRAKS
jgi:hypothetical protein